MNAIRRNASSHERRFRILDRPARAMLLVAILAFGYSGEVLADPQAKPVIVENAPLDVSVVDEPVSVSVTNDVVDVSVAGQPVDVLVVNEDPPVSVGSYFFVLSATGSPDSTIDAQTIDQPILITGVDISTHVVSNQRCRWAILRDAVDTGNPGGITTNTTLIQHHAYQPGVLHHELAEPARVSADQSFSIRLTALGGSCAGEGIIRFVLE
jgi:hypothetical protein